MKKLLAISIILLLAFSLHSEVQFSGSITSEFSLGLPYTDRAFKANSGSLAFDFDLSFYKENLSLVSASTLTLDGVKDASRDNSYFFSDFKRAYLSIKELYLDYYQDKFSLRFGRQLVSFGAADSLTVTNILCPEDMTKLAGDELADKRLGIDALKLSYSAGDSIVDLYYIPFFTRTAMPLEDGNPIRSVLFPSSVALGGGENARVSSFTSDDIESPSLSFSSAEYALRFRRYLSKADFSLYGFYGYENTPLISYKLTGSSPNYILKLDGEYSRTLMLGADTSIPVGSKTVRLEAAYFPFRPFQTSAKSQLTGSSSRYRERGEFAILAGLDYLGPTWTVTGQYYLSYILGDVEALDREAFDNKATISISRSLGGDEFEVSLSAILGLNYLDTAINPKIKYRFNDDIVFTLSALIMNTGTDKSKGYGRFRELSSLAFKCVYSY